MSVLACQAPLESFSDSDSDMDMGDDGEEIALFDFDDDDDLNTESSSEMENEYVDKTQYVYYMIVFLIKSSIICFNG